MKVCVLSHHGFLILITCENNVSCTWGYMGCFKINSTHFFTCFKCRTFYITHIALIMLLCPERAVWLCPREAAVNKIPCLTGAAGLCQGHSSEYDLSEAKLSSIVYICPSTFILLKVNSFERHLCTVCACVLMPQRVCKCTYAYHKYGGRRSTYRRQFFIPLS